MAQPQGEEDEGVEPNQGTLRLNTRFCCLNPPLPLLSSDSRPTAAQAPTLHLWNSRSSPPSPFTQLNLSPLHPFQNYKAKDSGTYTCNIKNDAGEANVELTLNIEGKGTD